MKYTCRYDAAGLLLSLINEGGRESFSVALKSEFGPCRVLSSACAPKDPLQAADYYRACLVLIDFATRSVLDIPDVVTINRKLALIDSQGKERS